MSELTLYTYCKSSASFRVRIVLNFKYLDYESKYIHLTKGGGENYFPQYKQINPQALVPTLVHAGNAINQSMSIIEYIEECYPERHVFPYEKYEKAQARSIAQIVACEIQPMNNIRVLKHLEYELSMDKPLIEQWYHRWIHEGFESIENMLREYNHSGKYCMGNQISVADAYLIPQVYNAKRWDCDLSAYPLIQEIYEHCMELDSFKAASPEQQEDYVE